MFAYDQIAYSGAVEAEAHPRYLEAIATLRGMRPAPLDSCRVLELGCASGKTLLQLAEEFPRSQFVGVDLAGKQIDEAQAIATEIGFENVQFHHGSLTTIDESWGKFDYILCVGVLSWVPPDIQEQIFRISAKNLADQGVTVVTYKTFPGWHYLNIVRDALRYHTDESLEPSERILAARELLAILSNETHAESLPGQVYRAENEYLQKAQDDYFFHDYLTSESYPFYFREFHQRVAEFGLQYLGETNFARNNLPPQATAARTVLTNGTLADRCQMSDFFNNAYYRKSILCSGDVVLGESIDPLAMQMLKLSLREIPTPANFSVTSSDVLSFKYESGTLDVAAPFGKAALRYLINRYPRPVTISELCRGASALLSTSATQRGFEGERGERLLANAMLGSLEAGLIQVCIREPEFAAEISDKPIASPLARTLARRSNTVANRCHQNVSLGRDAACLLPHLDGTKDHHDLSMLLKTTPTATQVPQQSSLEQRVSIALAELFDRVFLVR